MRARKMAHPNVAAVDLASQKFRLPGYVSNIHKNFTQFNYLIIGEAPAKMVQVKHAVSLNCADGPRSRQG